MIFRAINAKGRRRRGAVAVLMVICLIPLIGVLAMVLDGGLLMGERRRAQAAADASAHAAACKLYLNNSVDAGLDPRGIARTAALSIASANGYSNDGSTSTVTLNVPPTSGTFSGQAGYAEAIVTYKQPKMFSAIWGAGTISVSGRAVARGTMAPASKASLILLEPSSAGSLSLAGSGHVIAASAIQVNSSNSGAISATNTGYATAPAIDINGNYTSNSGGYLSGTVNPHSSTVANPLAKLVAPSASGLPAQSSSLRGYGSQTINPGVYTGGLTIGGGQTITMNPGTYYMKGGSFNIGNGAAVTGKGVTIYVDAGGGQISFQGGGVITLSGPTTGAYSGVVMFIDHASSQGISIANGSTSNITGTVYAPNAAVSFAGGASASQYGSQFICKTMNVSNNADVRVNWSSSTVATSRALGLVE